MKRYSIAQGARFWVLGDRCWVMADRCWVMDVRLMKFIIFHLSFFISLASCSPTPTPPTTSSSSSLTILFTGDVLLDRGIRNTAEHRGIGYLFEEVTPIFREADAVVVNLECPLTDTISPVNKKYIFRGDARWAKDLRSVGITHAAMANNHTNDHGRRGLQATARHLADAGITPLGYGRNFSEQISPVLVEKDGISVALFNATTLTIENWCRLDDKPGIAQPTEDELLDEIGDFHSKHPDTHIVVVLHWGVEFQPYPTIRQRALAHRLSEAGVAAIIGHHPHVLQPIDTIGKMPVYYSIGNFVFDQKNPKSRESMIARLTFHGDGTLSADSISVRIEQGRPVIRKSPTTISNME